MGLSEVLSGIAGGAKGAAAGFSWQKEFGQKEREISSREEIARLRAEVQQMINEANNSTRRDVANTGADSRRDVAETAAGSRVDVANITQGGANYRHDTASGDTTAREAGADRRLTKNLDFGMTKLNRDSADRRYGIDTRSSDSRYGVDTRSGDSRYATETGAETTRRGQDVRSGDSRYSTDKRNAMFQGVFGPTPVTPAGAKPAVQVPDREKEVQDTTTTPTAAPTLNGRTPVTVKPPVTPPAAAPPVQPQDAAAAADREVQRRTRFEQIKRDIEDRKRKGQDFSDLVKELQKLRGGAQ